MSFGRILVVLLLSISWTSADPLEKSYQAGLLSFSEWDLNKDCIVTYDEFKSWVLDMLLSIMKFQALVEAEKPSQSVFEEETYDNVMRRVFENLNLISNQNANPTIIMDRLLSKLSRKINNPNQSDSTTKATIARIFKFNSRINLTFWYNV